MAVEKRVPQKEQCVKNSNIAPFLLKRTSTTQSRFAALLHAKKTIKKLPEKRAKETKCLKKMHQLIAEKPQKLRNELLIETYHHSQTALPIERLIEQHSTILVHAKIAASADDDINHLIKKLALSFSAKKNRADFVVGTGVFKDSQFILTSQGQQLSLQVANASDGAKNLLENQQDVLRKRLALHEINLKSLLFTA